VRFVPSLPARAVVLVEEGGSRGESEASCDKLEISLRDFFDVPEEYATDEDLFTFSASVS
jgi:hypothetical protein